jgi:hypothetical protein
MALHITLIHNNESERLSYIRPLLEKISKVYSAKYSEIYFQTPRYISFINVLVRKYYIVYSGRKWRKSLNGEKKEVFINSIIEAITDTFKIFSKNFRYTQKNKLKIEDMLSRKHHEALMRFSNQAKANDVLICFESDVIIPSIDYFLEALNYLFENACDKDFYLLAFPFSENDICLNESEWKKSEKNNFSVIRENNPVAIHFPRLISNTACAYAMNYEMARRLADNSKNKFRRIFLPADFHQNLVFLTLRKRRLDRNGKTIIFMPPPVLNGSLKSYYKSDLSEIER